MFSVTKFKSGIVCYRGASMGPSALTRGNVLSITVYNAVGKRSDNWLLVITVVEDPKYLNQPFYTSTQFKLQPDGSKFDPTALLDCAAPPK